MDIDGDAGLWLAHGKLHSDYQMIVCRRKTARTATAKFFTLHNVREEWESCLLSGSCRLGVDLTVALLSTITEYFLCVCIRFG